MSRILQALRRPPPSPAVPPEQLLLEFHRGLSLIVDEEPLRAWAIARLREWTEAERLILYTRDARTGTFGPVASAGLSRANGNVETVLPPLAAEGRFVEWLERNGQPMYLPDHDGVLDHFHEDERAMLRDHDLSLCLPLSSLQRLHGFLLAGGIRPERAAALTTDRWTQILLTQVGLALEHASLVARQRARIQQMYWADRLAIAGQLAAGAAHEIRNPLTTVRSTIQYVAGHLQEPRLQRSLEELLSEVDRVDAIVDGLLSFARPTHEVEERVAIAAELGLVLDLVEAPARKSRVQVERSIDRQDLFVRGDPAKLRQVFLNLAMNALQAMPEGGVLKVGVETRTTSSQQEVAVTFADTGVGIPAENLDHIFDPFFTTRHDGTGLGLSISYGIVSSHGGTIAADSVEGEGTTMVVELPLDTEAEETVDG